VAGVRVRVDEMLSQQVVAPRLWMRCYLSRVMDGGRCPGSEGLRVERRPPFPADAYASDGPWTVACADGEPRTTPPGPPSARSKERGSNGMAIWQ